MQQEQQEQAQQQTGATMNQNYNSTALELRLDTQPIIDKIELFLSGMKTVYIEDANGQILVKKIKISTPKMNEEGTEYIISFLTSVFSSAVVQGNWKEDFFRERLYEIREQLAFAIMVNTHKWEIIPTSRHMIMTILMETMAGYLSRLLENKERASYIPTLRSIETVNNNDNQAKSPSLMNGMGLLKR
jgi:hypothetical protein